jgi:cytoskeletal protein CcmA (bactofilin family)
MVFKNTKELESFSFIGLNSDFRGELNIKGELRVEGIINGPVNADSVIFGQAARVKGEITAKRIIVEGKVEGNLRAEEIVEIKSTGKVFGEIFTNKISIMGGGVINGRVEMKADESKVVEFEPVAKA